MARLLLACLLLLALAGASGAPLRLPAAVHPVGLRAAAPVHPTFGVVQRQDFGFWVQEVSPDNADLRLHGAGNREAVGRAGLGEDEKRPKREKLEVVILWPESSKPRS